jgi:hypothetical protein
MKVKLTTYHRYVNYWNNYTDEINLSMINAIQKAATWANTGLFSEAVKLYALYMIDGEKIYTDYAGFRRLLKQARELGVDLNVL